MRGKWKDMGYHRDFDEHSNDIGSWASGSFCSSSYVLKEEEAQCFLGLAVGSKE